MESDILYIIFRLLWAFQYSYALSHLLMVSGHVILPVKLIMKSHTLSGHVILSVKLIMKSHTLSGHVILPVKLIMKSHTLSTKCREQKKSNSKRHWKSFVCFRRFWLSNQLIKWNGLPALLEIVNTCRLLHQSGRFYPFVSNLWRLKNHKVFSNFKRFWRRPNL